MPGGNGVPAALLAASLRALRRLFHAICWALYHVSKSSFSMVCTEAPKALARKKMIGAELFGGRKFGILNIVIELESRKVQNLRPEPG
jgi:hypothetical protein